MPSLLASVLFVKLGVFEKLNAPLARLIENLSSSAPPEMNQYVFGFLFFRFTFGPKNVVDALV